jgi:hypothetical protein
VDADGIVILVQMQPKMDIWMLSNGVVKMDAYAKYVVNMGIWIDGLFMELQQYIYIYITLIIVLIYIATVFAVTGLEWFEPPRDIPIRTRVFYSMLYTFSLFDGWYSQVHGLGVGVSWCLLNCKSLMPNSLFFFFLLPSSPCSLYLLFHPPCFPLMPGSSYFAIRHFSDPTI